ncbi:MAG TPA: PAS domain-containing protein [Calditrichia bacterium]|nr:PAS domain-containing protein [Calditrichota bacterium]HQV30626.1 PAS domain-containing protein [Calditrichia bacterium]
MSVFFDKLLHRLPFLSRLRRLKRRQRAELEKEQALRKLAESESSLDLAIWGGHLGLWEWDIPADRVTNHWLTLLGYQPQDFAQNFGTWEKLVHPEDYQTLLSQMKAYLDGELDFFEVEFRAKNKAGNYHWILCRGKITDWDDGGMPVRMAGTQLEISNARRDQEALKFQETIINSINDAIISVDLDSRIMTWNNAAEAMYGYSREEAIGQKSNDLLRVHYTNQKRDWVLKVLAEEGEWQGETIQYHKDGTALDIFSSTVMIFDDSDKPYCIATVNRDITDRKSNEKRLKNLARELRRSNKELEEFAYVASHDLKEPLRGLNNYASFIMEDYHDKLDDEGRHKLETLQRLSRRMEELLDSLLQYSRVGRLDLAFAEVDLNRLIKTVLENLRVAVSEKKARITVQENFPVTRCDRVRLGEVFQNLIGNALKYNDKSEPEIEVGFLRKGATTPEGEKVPGPVFFVKDNGIGIKEKHHDVIFKIFKRLHGRDKYGGGSGAGLTIVDKIINRHKGRIWLSSVPGEGSTFFFTVNIEEGDSHKK